jgi:hypothetical protein
METSNPKVDSLSESLLAFRFPTDETTVRNSYRKLENKWFWNSFGILLPPAFLTNF